MASRSSDTTLDSDVRQTSGSSKQKRDERASSLVPGSVTRQVIRFQPLRVKILVALSLCSAATCRRFLPSAVSLGARHADRDESPARRLAGHVNRGAARVDRVRALGYPL